MSKTPRLECVIILCDPQDIIDACKNNKTIVFTEEIVDPEEKVKKYFTYHLGYGYSEVDKIFDFFIGDRYFYYNSEICNYFFYNN